MRDLLERQQTWIYFAAVALGTALAVAVPATEGLARAVTPALAFMLFVTFLQVPLARIGAAFAEMRFLAALLTANFIFIPLLVFALSRLAPTDAMLRLGILMVLLTPCIDYVITFAHLGRADTRLLLASIPVLLVVQMALLPVYLTVFLGSESAGLISAGPFLHAFLWLIVMPLLLAGTVQALRPRAAAVLGLAPVPATALVLFLVVASTIPVLGAAAGAALSALPLYVGFAILAPMIGWATARLFRLRAGGARAVAFSSGTRNSLVVLPLALSVPGAVPILPAVIVTQTLVELLAEMVYIRAIAKLGRGDLQ
ncbi:arsenic resistance protein [Falsirhodobacter deserti]|uniref:arsenic resistance protein n=1 Tax=Falsirhodobacter deserti TaxID=1365611 RepID=UPI0019D43C05|nr:arsenic resistance protein [Falsirhodobacter deserti]